MTRSRADELLTQWTEVADSLPQPTSFRRPSSTGRNALVAVVGAVVLVVAGAAVLASLPNNQVAVLPTGSPSPSPASPQPSPAPPSASPTISPTAAVQSPVPSTSSQPAWTLDWATPATLPREWLFDDIVQLRTSYVAVGEIIGGTSSQAAAWVSTDGQTWEQTMNIGTASEEARVRQVVVTTHGLVAVGWEGVLHCPPGGEGAPPCDPLPIVFWTSGDGKTWTQHDAGDAFAGTQVSAIATDGSKLIAVGSTAAGDPAIWTSDDGATWQAMQLAGDWVKAHLMDIAWSGSAWLIAGSVGDIPVQSGGAIEAPPTTATIWLSPDATSWLRAIIDGADGAYAFSGLWVGADGVVAMGMSDSKSGSSWRSSDGMRWLAVPATGRGVPLSPQTSDGAEIIGSSYADGDRVGYSISSDGVNWHALDDLGAVDQRPHWQARPQADGSFITRGALFVFSSDGFIWKASISLP